MKITDSKKMNVFSIKTIICTGFALLAFAGNSVLCRLALGEGAIDAASFTVIRLLSGIIVLAAILMITNNINTDMNNEPTSKGSWLSSLMLFIYAVTFSFAYISLDTGTGALILFGAVQVTMILVSMMSGNRLHYSEWVGFLIAFSGFIYLMTPSLSTPPLAGFALMTISGIAWGIYTLKGRGSKNPISDTTYNFLRTLPFVVILAVLAIREAHLTQEGILLAALSGGIASGLGYALWYVALRGLSVTQAAVFQLLVPVIAALGGVIFASEVISLRLMLSSMMILGGILSVVAGRYYFVQMASNQK